MPQFGIRLDGEPLQHLLRSPQRSSTTAMPSLRWIFAIIAALVVLCAAALFFLTGRGDYKPVWHEERLASGATVKVTSMNLVWGADHDDHALGGDCFSMEYATATPDADPKSKDEEVQEVFELIRPASELWGFKSAEVARFPTITRKGHYDLYEFVRGSDGKWSFTEEPRKVFATD